MGEYDSTATSNTQRGAEQDSGAFCGLQARLLREAGLFLKSDSRLPVVGEVATEPKSGGFGCDFADAEQNNHPRTKSLNCLQKGLLLTLINAQKESNWLSTATNLRTAQKAPTRS